MAKEDKVKHLILACRYYNGEDDNPFVHEMEEQGESDELNDEITAWNYECYWVNEKHSGNDFKGYLEDFAHAFSEFKADDTPTDLIAVLWNRYQQWVSDGPEGFTEWYSRRYQSRETNRQRRAKERRKILIPRCRYYRGEEECPEHSGMYSMFWDYEKLWVEALAYSFKRGEEWRKDFEQAHAWLLAKQYEIPATLVGLLYNRYMHWGSGHETTLDFNKWLEENYVKPSESLVKPHALGFGEGGEKI